MYRQDLPSSLLSDVVEELATLPGIGRRSALRLALHILNRPVESVEKFGNSFIRMRRDVNFCPQCNMISDNSACPLCTDRSRDRSIICVVESIRDVISIERTSQYHGLYHVLGHVISPMDGIGPSDLPIEALISRASVPETKEILLALNTSTEGETTAFYLYKRLSSSNVNITTIARGVAFGDDLEYTDELTLGRSIQNRQIFNPEK